MSSGLDDNVWQAVPGTGLMAHDELQRAIDSTMHLLEWTVETGNARGAVYDDHEALVWEHLETLLTVQRARARPVDITQPGAGPSGGGPHG